MTTLLYMNIKSYTTLRGEQVECVRATQVRGKEIGSKYTGLVTCQPGPRDGRQVSREIYTWEALSTQLYLSPT